MKLKYSIMDPTGNVTALVETAVPVDQQPSVAEKIMSIEATVEQVGFISDSEGVDLALRMAGGEFCGNATMSAAVLYAIRKKKSFGKVKVFSSGVNDAINVDVKKENGFWQGTVEMPKAKSIDDFVFPDGRAFPVVRFDGITHVIFSDPVAKSEAEKLVRCWCALLNAPALGLMFFEESKNRLTPLVYVPEADTLFWESACGSGLSAVGAYMAKRTNRFSKLSPKQPGGTLEITAMPTGELFLCGNVKLLCEKEIKLS